MIPVPTVSTDLEFQTVFQILCAIEGLFVWKGAKLVGTIARAKINEEVPFDEGAFKGVLEKLASEESNRCWRLFKLFAMTAWYKVRKVSAPAIALIRRGFWAFLVWFHNAISRVLRWTAPISISLVAASYFLQIGCDAERFREGVWVFRFLLVKAACCVLCILLEWFYKWRIGVPAQSEMINENISADSPPAGSASPPSSAPA